MIEFTVGIVCSGNTCRSPIAAAWLRHLLDGDPSRPAQIWTAGLKVEENEKKVEQEPLLVALDMGMSPMLIRDLEKHEAREVSSEFRSTDLLVWITDPDKLGSSDDGDSTRIERMRDKAKALGAFLLVVPEADHAWEAKQRGESASKVMEAYRDQANSLRRWAWRLHSLIPSTSATNSAG